jgi:glycosyltransferase involved in cell wall biosynthesis
MTAPRRVLALAHDPAGPSARYRVRQFVAPLRADGFAVELVALPRGTAARRRFLAALPPHDLVVLSRVLLGAGETKWLRRAARRLVYDVDDALPFRTPWEGGGRSARRAARFARLCAVADAVVAGNAWIAELAGATARHVAIVPTVVDPAGYPEGAARGDGRTLAWIGQPATVPYLAGIAGPLAELARTRPGLCLQCVGGEPPAVAGLAVRAVAWSETTEAAALHAADVGLAPLTDDEWSRGKCALRLLQYAAAGLPAVASPVGTQARLVAAGAALGAATSEAWVDALARLLNDGDARTALAARARAVLAESYSMRAALPALREAWEFALAP